MTTPASSRPISELAWRLADYRQANVDPPHRCVSNPEQTEGQMMSDDEIAEFIKDSIATLRILSDKHSPRHADLLAIYYADLAYLSQIGRLSDDDYDELTAPENLHF